MIEPLTYKETVQIEDVIVKLISWTVYLEEYFKDKHDLKGTIDEARTAIKILHKIKEVK